MSKEQIKIYEELGKGLAIMYINALDESGSSEIADNKAIFEDTIK